MHTNNKGKISYVLQAINLIPLLTFGIIIMLLGNHLFTKIMHEEVKIGLDNVAHNIVTLLNITYPGDYHLEGEIAYQLYKGDRDLTTNHALLDRIKEDTGLDITLFYQDTRILTTLTDSSGERIIGTGAPDVIIRDVLHAGKSCFYNNVIINNGEFFAYYMPLSNSDGTVVGMLFVGKPSDQVNNAIQSSVYPLIIACGVAMIVTAVCIFFYTRGFTSVLLKIHGFLTSVSNGNLNAELDPSVLRRNDELGDIGRSTLSMQRSLRKMIELDTLTELFNRRSADQKLHQVIEKSIAQQTPFSLALGDIDFFKKVNDTYGHDCGDMVLRTIADKLRSHMHNCGFVARWGGEEFLLVFDRANLLEAQHILEALLEDIRSTPNQYDGHTFTVTMTFGLVGGNTDDIKELLHQADMKLYEGKSSGRNQIIV